MAAGPVDHVALALARLPEQFKNKEKIAALLTVFAKQCADLETAFQQLLTERNIETAVDAQLDVIGDIVGQPRNGASDDLYRRRIRTRITVNRSKGRVHDAITVARLVLDDDDAVIALAQHPIASYVLRVGGIAVTAAVHGVLIDFLRQATAAGVRVILETSESLPADTFTLDTGPGYDVGRFASASD